MHIPKFSSPDGELEYSKTEFLASWKKENIHHVASSFIWSTESTVLTSPIGFCSEQLIRQTPIITMTVLFLLSISLRSNRMYRQEDTLHFPFCVPSCFWTEITCNWVEFHNILMELLVLIPNNEVAGFTLKGVFWKQRNLYSSLEHILQYPAVWYRRYEIYW